jgi:hypothetical protein
MGASLQATLLPLTLPIVTPEGQPFGVPAEAFITAAPLPAEEHTAGRMRVEGSTCVAVVMGAAAFMRAEACTHAAAAITGRAVFMHPEASTHAAAGIMVAGAPTRPEGSKRVAAAITGLAAFMHPEACTHAAAGIMGAAAPMRPDVFTHGAHAAACMRGEVVTRAGIRPPNNMAAFERKPPSPGRR